MPGYLAALLFCVGVVTVVVFLTIGQKWLPIWQRRILVTCGLLLALAMCLYLALTMLLLIRD